MAPVYMMKPLRNIK